MCTEVLWSSEATFFAKKKKKKILTASKIGKAEQQVLPCSGRPVAPVKREMLQRADSIVR